MDVVIIMTAIAELLNFPKIPVKVTMNEYIEMAKSYSTPRSGFFVNGILGVIIAMLRRDGKLQKPE
jgi:N utilization substance protein B